MTDREDWLRGELRHVRRMALLLGVIVMLAIMGLFLAPLVR